jgi:hypothetical protein
MAMGILSKALVAALDYHENGMHEPFFWLKAEARHRC